MVAKGNLPCPKQLAVTLAAAALYVEDLEEVSFTRFQRGCFEKF